MSKKQKSYQNLTAESGSKKDLVFTGKSSYSGSVGYGYLGKVEYPQTNTPTL